MMFIFSSCNNEKVMSNTLILKKIKLGQKFFQLHGEENFDAMAEMLHDDLQWTSPKYGEGLVTKETQLGYIKMYQDLYDNIKFEAEYWLPGVDPETLQNDGSVRTYGTWTGVHTESGKEFALKSYHPMAFKDGKIVGGGDYFDFGGFMASFQ